MKRIQDKGLKEMDGVLWKKYVLTIFCDLFEIKHTIFFLFLYKDLQYNIVSVIDISFSRQI